MPLQTPQNTRFEPTTFFLKKCSRHVVNVVKNVVDVVNRIKIGYFYSI